MLGGSLSCGSTIEDNAALGFSIIATFRLVSRRHDGEALRRTWSVMRLGLRLMGIRQVSMTGDVIVCRVQNRKLISESGLRSRLLFIPKRKLVGKLSVYGYISIMSNLAPGYNFIVVVTVAVLCASWFYCAPLSGHLLERLMSRKCEFYSRRSGWF